jgi:DNA-binding CsgD family transcriptional regulator/tetratricopeptide (TPR) repeat protein
MSSTTLPTLLERAQHLTALEAHLNQAAAGEGQFVFLGGEAGVGKSALVQHLCHRVHESARLLVGACDPLSTPRPLGPLLDIAQEAGGELDRLIAADGPRHMLFRAALDALTDNRPTLFVIEDAHWADEATLDLLRYLGRRIGDTRSLLLVTYRDDEVGPAHPLRVVTGDLATASMVHRMLLTPLSAAAVRTLAAHSRMDPVALYRRTGGNPFFVTEVLASGERDVPATVQDAVLARIGRLSPAARSILDAAAVIGARLEPWLLDAVGGEDAAAVDECLAVGVLRPERDLLAFRHELARDAVLAAIPARRRRILHAAALAALRSAPTSAADPDRLAHHAEAAGDREAVLRFAPAAARRAAELDANREATAQYARALRFAEGVPDEERLALLEAYAQVADLAAWGASGIRPRQEMIALARRLGDRAREAEHLGWLSSTLALDGQYSEASQAASAALSIVESLPEGAAHATVFGRQAFLAEQMGDLAAAVTWGERAIMVAERLGDHERTLLGLNIVGEAWLHQGEIARGRTVLERSLLLAQRTGLPGFVVAALSDLGEAQCAIYRFDDADHCLSQGIAYAIDHDLDSWRWNMVPRLALTRHFQGRWTEATELAASVLHLPIATTPHPRDPIAGEAAASVFAIPVYIRVVALLALGRVRARRGDPGAWDVLEEALALATPSGVFQSLGPVHAARAEAAWLEGDRKLTIHEVRAAREVTVGHHSGWITGELALWLWRAGELTEPPTEAAEPFVLQMRGDWAGAAAAWQALGCPYEAARALADSDDPAVLREALVACEQLGARPSAVALKRRLHALGARDIPRGPRPMTRANPAHLTPREAEILALIAAGGTNVEIAERLYLSPKTVEHHVSAILAKLRSHSRREAVATAREWGMLPAV